MKTEHWIILFLTIFIMLFSLGAFKYYQYSKNVKENIKLERNLSASVEAAMNEAILYKNGELYFYNEMVRDRILDAFREQYNFCNGYISPNDCEIVNFEVPVIMMIDNDGYYVAYRKVTTGTTISSDQITTNLNTWSQVYDGNQIAVRYYLNDFVTLKVIGTNHEYFGSYDEVYKELRQYAVSTGISISEITAIFTNANNFEKEKNDVIISRISTDMNYYINYHNESFNKHDTKYDIYFAHSTEDTTARIIDEPCIYAFAQGKQSSYGILTYNVYSLAASEIIKEKIYYVAKDAYDGKLYYHNKDCSTPHTLFSFLGTMKECAKHGANPCPECLD